MEDHIIMEQIQAVYRLTCEASEVEKLARDIALEQTVEVPEAMITDETLRDKVVGHVGDIQPIDGERNAYRVPIHYNAELANGQIGQLLNLVYGNISMKRHIRLVDLHLPESLLGAFPGPRFGTEGIRSRIGIHGRPLLSTALKPRGAPVQTLAETAYQFALGGGDLVKDDHNLVDNSWDAFRSRLEACQKAVEQANRETGRNCLYFPNISGRIEAVEQQLEFAASLGIRGVLIAPLLLGLDVTRYLRERHALALMAHPTFTGAFFHDSSHGMAPGLMLGKLFRLIGSDVSIFPNAGGRFTFSQSDCRRIGDELRAPLGTLRPGFPSPAGGMRYDTLPTMGREFGQDAVLLIGGALLTHSDSLRKSTSIFLDRIREQFSEEHTQPITDAASACEVPASSPAGELLEHIRFQDDFSWVGRESEPYKTGSGELPFQGVRRVELVGKSGEKAAFDLRYFEIEPGGFTSLEQHHHAHVVIGARGQGTLLNGDQRIPLNRYDVGYVPPMRVHQLRNETEEPFGFFCIVDHERDRPQPPKEE